MFDKIFDIGMLIFQVLDFAVKAVTHFSDTPEGAKEFADVQAALIELGLLDPPEEAPPVTEPTPPTESLWAQLVENGKNYSQEDLSAEIARQSEEREELGRNVFRAPKRHGGTVQSE